MALRRNILIILVYIIGLYVSLTISQTVHKNPQQYESEIIENTTFSFVRCNNITESRQMLNCTVFLETNSSSNKSSCEVTLISERDNIIGNITRTVSYGRDKVILIWLEKEGNVNLLVRFNVVNLSNCKSTSSKIIFDAKKFSDPSIDEIVEWGVSIVTYKNTFDVFYANESSDSYEFCKQSFSNDKFEEPICIQSTFSLPSYTLFHTINPDATVSKGYVLFLPSGESINAWLMTATGETKIIEKYKIIIQPIRRFLVSSSNEAIGICYQRKLGKMFSITNATCTRYNIENMNKSSESHLNLEDNEKIIDMYNLPNAGFLALTVKCSPYSCFGSDNAKFRVLKLNGDKEKFKPLDINGFKCADDIFSVKKRTQFFEDDTGKFCLSFLCYRNSFEESNRRFNVTTTCFSNQQLSDISST